MKYCVFFRNLNLGRPNCPSRTQLEGAFLKAGATAAASFLTNGTLVFSTPAGKSAARILSRAQELLRQECGLKEPAFLRELTHLATLADSEPFKGVELHGVYDCFVTFLDRKVVFPKNAVLKTPRGEVEVVFRTATEAFCLSRKITQSPGSPNAFLEKLLQRPATTRAWNTVLRLLKKHGNPPP